MSYKCPHCDRVFAKAMHLGRHVTSKHARAKARQRVKVLQVVTSGVSLSELVERITQDVSAVAELVRMTQANYERLLSEHQDLQTRFERIRGYLNIDEKADRIQKMSQ